MSRYVKEHSLDIPHYSAVEFPLVVNNTDKAIDLVGGEPALVKAAQDHEQNPLELRFSKNKYEHPLASTLSTNENIIIKISVPTKEYEESGKNIRKTLAHLNKAGKHKPVSIQPVGIINKTFRFRELSDFQYQTGSDQFISKTNSALHDLNYTELKENFKFTQDKEPSIVDRTTGSFNFPPPPRFSSIPLPFDYRYTKNTNSVEKEGKYEVRNRPFRLHASVLKYDDPIPIEPPKAVTEKLDYYLQNFTRNTTYRDTLKVIDLLKALFEKRPIWIRKHLEAIIPVHLRYTVKYALPHIAYTYIDGPWRQNYIKFGINPKSSVQYARYQLGAFRVNGYRNPRNLRTFVTDQPNDIATGFKFNGTDLPITLLFQIEQLIDPEVVEFVKHVKFKEEPDFENGWFDKLTMDKIRLVVPFKLKSLIRDEDYDEKRLEVLLKRLEQTAAEGLETSGPTSDDEEMDLDNDNDRNDMESDDDEDDDEDEDEFFDQTLRPDTQDSHNLDQEMEFLNVQESNFDEILSYLEKQHPEGAIELRSMISGIAKLGQMDLS
ncbi:hypothetical protein WICPIJ_006528 [Wickerhamomyces pijperi]|uniref:Transcription factor IIIC subunit 5 HTH domain-containing protein n=1 Tax=Wickerhamomyces pijperi TaxID=599730 RepID=A0A9P8Q1H3_WICPI|nr:hypothetical protein WICPIJ_006528 [Wickerhamomyces pijperi]